MLYQTFRQFPDGTLAKFGRTTPRLIAAVERAAACGGEVRPLGSLTPCWASGVFLTGKAMQPATVQSGVTRYCPARKAK